MYKGYEVSRTWVVAAAISLVSVAVASILYRGADKSKLSASRAYRQQMNIRLAEISDLEGKGNEHALAEARERSESWEQQLLAPGVVGSLISEFGQSWQYRHLAGDPNIPGTQVIGEVRYVEPSVAYWPFVVASLEKLESASPLATIREVAIVSDGDLSIRRFASVRFQFSYFTAGNNSK